MVGKCINNATTGYSAYLIANKKENLMTTYAIISVVIEFIIIQIFLKLRLNIEFVILAITIGSMVYTSLIVVKGLRSLYGYCTLRAWLTELFSDGNWFVLTIVLLYSLVWTNIYFFSSSICIFYILYHKNINSSILNGLNIIRNKNSLNF